MKEKSVIVAFPVLLIPDVWPVLVPQFGLFVVVAVSPRQGTFGNILPKMPKNAVRGSKILPIYRHNSILCFVCNENSLGCFS